MRKLGRGLLLAVVCLLLMAQPIAVQAVSGNEVETNNTEEASTSIKEKYYVRLANYKSNLYIVNDLSKESKDKIEKLYYNANYYIANNKLSESDIASYISTIESSMSAVVSADTSGKPTTTKEFIAVGDNVQTPVANYGKEVAVILPIINLGESNITNIIVTPVTDASVSKWPFELDKTSYSEVVEELPGSTSKENAIINRREVGYFFKTRADVLSGYYKLEYNVTYSINGTIETTTLSTYVQTVGAPGSGNIDQSPENAGKSSTPRIIVTGFETTPAVVNAGDTFTLNIHVQNTSKRTAVSNVEFDLEAAQEGKDETAVYSAFLPTSGSNTVYIDQIPIGGNADLTIEMTAKADLAQKPYVLNIKMHYEDDKYNPYEATASVSIPVKQEAKFETSSPEIMPADIVVGEQSNIMFSLYNTGKTTLYNAQVKFIGDSITGGDTFVGKIEPGATGNVDAMVTGQAATMDEGIIKAVISYEDAAGNVTETEKELTLRVSEDMMGGGDMGEVDLGGMEPPETKSPVGMIIAIAAAVVIIVVVVVIVMVKRKKKKKALKELTEDIEGLENTDSTEEKGE